MPTFAYDAVNNAGKKQGGTIDAGGPVIVNGIVYINGSARGLKDQSAFQHLYIVIKLFERNIFKWNDLG